MKYFLIFLLFLVGCSDTKQKDKKLYIEDVVKTTNTTNTPKINIININNLKFKEIDDNISYNFDTPKILLFIDNSKESTLQIKELKKLNKKYYIIKNSKLIKFFNIVSFPTIVITKDNNNTKKYEGFIPNEILKYELKD